MKMVKIYREPEPVDEYDTAADKASANAERKCFEKRVAAHWSKLDEATRRRINQAATAHNRNVCELWDLRNKEHVVSAKVEQGYHALAIMLGLPMDIIRW